MRSCMLKWSNAQLHAEAGVCYSAIVLARLRLLIRSLCIHAAEYHKHGRSWVAVRCPCGTTLQRAVQQPPHALSQFSIRQQFLCSSGRSSNLLRHRKCLAEQAPPRATVRHVILAQLCALLAAVWTQRRRRSQFSLAAVSHGQVCRQRRWPQRPQAGAIRAVPPSLATFWPSFPPRLAILAIDGQSAEATHTAPHDCAATQLTPSNYIARDDQCICWERAGLLHQWLRLARGQPHNQEPRPRLTVPAEPSPVRCRAP
jgi:hypothetical protein